MGYCERVVFVSYLGRIYHGLAVFVGIVKTVLLQNKFGGNEGFF